MHGEKAEFVQDFGVKVKKKEITRKNKTSVVQ
jgi:hypothetical protein